MKKTLFIAVMMFVSFTQCDSASSNPIKDEEPPEVVKPPLKVGYSIPIGGDKFKLENLEYAKAVGVDYVEASGMAAFLDSNRNFKMTDEEIIEKLEWAKKNADAAGIKIWSIHMPFGQNIDLSLISENDREDVVAKQSKLIGFLKILEPKIILFHPSYYLGLNERSGRKSQFIKSALALNEKVQEINATMVIENMLGPELLKDKNRERPLLRTVEETVEVMGRLPKSIGLAIDFNHIKHPEKLVLAMGDRLKTLHVNDGSGKAEDHYFPCSGKGEQNWNKIFSALDQVEYDGPFMYETTEYDDEAELLKCYTTLYNNYLNMTK